MSISSKHPESFRQSLGHLMSVNNWVNKLYISSSQSDINLTASEAVTLYQPLRNSQSSKKNSSFAMKRTPHCQSTNNVNKFDSSLVIQTAAMYT